MSTPVNYYLSMKRGDNNNPFAITSGTTTVGATADIELRMQIDNGTSTTGLRRLDVKKALETILAFVESGGLNHAGANLPAN